MDDRMTRACKLAMKHHAGQMYGKYSYMYHLEEVAGHVKDIVRKGLFGVLGLDRDAILCIAYLHDILEDTDCKVEKIAEILNRQEYVEAVLLLTKDTKATTYEKYLDNVKGNPYARIVKIADTWANLNNSFKAGDVKRITKYSKQLQILLED